MLRNERNESGGLLFIVLALEVEEGVESRGGVFGEMFLNLDDASSCTGEVRLREPNLLVDDVPAERLPLALLNASATSNEGERPRNTMFPMDEAGVVIFTVVG